jgi:PAS domain S-box-containing protein
LNFVCLVLTCFKPGAEEFIRVGMLMLGKDWRYSVNFDQASFGFGLIDSSTGNLIKANKKFCDIVGFEFDTADGRSFMEIAHPDGMEPKLQNMQELLEGGLDEFSMTMQEPLDDGSMAHWKLTILMVGEFSDYDHCHLAIIEDVSVRKNAEEKAQTINDLLGQRVLDLTAALEEKTKELEATEKLLKEELPKLREAN